MKVTAQLNNIRIAQRKVKLTADLIRGLDVEDAKNQLNVAIKKSSPLIKKLLDSAIANAENNFGLDKTNLFVFDVTVGAGPTLRRWRARAYGRAARILKRTSNIEIILEERVEGKGRKSKEQMEKEKKERLEKLKKEEKARMEEKKKEDKKEEKKEEKKEKISRTTVETEKVKKEGAKKTWANKIFRRKSM